MPPSLPQGTPLAAALLGAALLSGAVDAQTPGVYHGTLGNTRVVMSLAERGGEQHSRYAYLHRGVDLRLTGEAQGERLTLTEYAPGAGTAQPTGFFEGRLAGGSYVGIWKSATGGRSLPFHLTRVNPTELRFNLTPTAWLRDLRTSDPYAFIKINHPLKRSAAGAARQETWTEPLSGVSFPRVTGIQDRAARERANLWLQDLHLRDALAALECLSDAGTNGGTWKQATRVVLQSNALVSVETNHDAYCGGPYPQTWVTSANWDVGRARPVTFAGAFDFGPGLVDFPKLLRNRFALSARACPARVLQNADPSEYAVTFTRDGLRVRVNLPHALDACEADATVIPYRSLRAYALPHSPLFRTLYP